LSFIFYLLRSQKEEFQEEQGRGKNILKLAKNTKRSTN